jgi:hypothetical protein
MFDTFKFQDHNETDRFYSQKYSRNMKVRAEDHMSIRVLFIIGSRDANKLKLPTELSDEDLKSEKVKTDPEFHTGLHRTTSSLRKHLRQIKDGDDHRQVVFHHRQVVFHHRQVVFHHRQVVFHHAEAALNRTTE